jgi:hypothetical protein
MSDNSFHILGNNNNNNNNNDPFWFQNIEILFQRDKLDKFLPTQDMTYIQKSNSIVRLSIYVGIVMSVLSKNYLYLYIPIGIMGFTYVMFLLRKVDNTSNKNIKNILNTTNQGNLNDNNVIKSHLNLVDSNSLENLNNNKNNKNNNIQNNGEGFNDTYNSSLNQRHQHHSINNKKSVQPTVDNPFMNTSPVAPRNIGPPSAPLTDKTEKLILSKFNTNIFKDANDIFNHSNGFRQFYTVPGNTFPNNRDTFMKWCYSRPKACKEGNGEQCYDNLYDDKGGFSYGSRSSRSKQM